MIQVTKIFRFEMAHAIDGYQGPCKNIHGHTYILHVTITRKNTDDQYVPSPGFVFDFKELKKIVKESVIKKLDHSLVLSSAFLKNQPAFAVAENIQIWEVEPSAENILIYIKNTIENILPAEISIENLKLYETSDSYAEWKRNK